MLGRVRAAFELEYQLVPSDLIHEAALEHRESARAVKARRTKNDVAYESFLAGARWDAEHNGRAELLDSNEALRDMLMRLLVRFALEPCPKCNSDGWDSAEMGDCKNCNGNGWLPKSNLTMKG